MDFSPNVSSILLNTIIGSAEQVRIFAFYLALQGGFHKSRPFLMQDYPAAERHQLLVEWNNTKSDKCVHQLFEAQVELTPDAVAVVFEDRQLTYRELNAKANQLAHYLQKLGVKAEVLVGICVQRSLEIVVELLGILKADRAYVPLDPGFPKQRLAAMLEDSQVPVLVTSST
jgi:non-ribosomal peptide synthetase component F